MRRVRQSGEIKWNGSMIYISEALVGEPIGLVEDDEGGWIVSYGRIELGVITLRGDRLNKPKRKPVDLWTTRRGVAHKAHRPSNNRPERNENCVTHVVGQNCYPCRRLLKL